MEAQQLCLAGLKSPRILRELDACCILCFEPELEVYVLLKAFFVERDFLPLLKM